MMPTWFEQLAIDKVIAIAREAGRAIMTVYQGEIDVANKADASPLTLADQLAHQCIQQGLQGLNQQLGVAIPLLSEEGAHGPYSERQHWTQLWLVDPLDGTKEFIKKNGEFTVNIALIVNQVPVLGVVYAPALDVCYYAKQGDGAYKDGQTLPRQNPAQLDVYPIVASRSHMSPETEAFIAQIPTNKPKELLSIGSSLKICLVAEGAAMVYPRLGPTMEWDTAAAHAIVNEVGGALKDPAGVPLVYNKTDLLNPHFIVSAA